MYIEDISLPVNPIELLEDSNMCRVIKCLAALSCGLLVLLAGAARSHAAGVAPLFDLSAPEKGPFPSDRFTVSDRDQLTRRRVQMPLPDCTKAPADCDDLSIINELDGFNLQPRLAVPFSGPIDPATVSSATLFLVALGDAAGGEEAGDDDRRRGTERRKVVGINQVVWDPIGNVLYAESDQALHQHSRYAIIVTSGIRDTAGDAVEAAAFETFRHDLNFGHTHDRGLKEYRKALLDALAASGIRPRDVVAASVFTTLSATAALEKIRDQIKSSSPAPADFNIAVNTRTGATARAVFELSQIPTGGIQFLAQTSASPDAKLTSQVVQLDAGRSIVPPGWTSTTSPLGTIAFGKFAARNYLRADVTIPPVPTRTGAPVTMPLAHDLLPDIYFNLLLPAGDQPSGGWPVAIYIHGTDVSKENAMYAVAATLAARGIATIGITNVGHGFGPRGTLTVTTTSGAAFTFPSGGRGFDRNGDGVIDTSEALYSPHVVINRRDGDRQSAIDLMQLVRVIEVGMDVDGDGVPDLNPSHIHCLGNSMGGFLGTILLAIEPSILVGSASATGGSIIDLARVGSRPIVAAALSARIPSLLNVLPAAPPLLGYDDNTPLRNQPPRTNTVAGAIEIQNFFERVEWADQAGDPVAYAPHIRERPLEGMPTKDVIIQLAKGDKTVPNPNTTALLRAGRLADRATYYRYDLVFTTFDAAEMAGAKGLTPAEFNRAKNPHVFLSNFTNPPANHAPVSSAIAFRNRDLLVDQLAAFFITNGESTIDPDGDGPVFETPIQGPLPEDLNFIP